MLTDHGSRDDAVTDNSRATEKYRIVGDGCFVVGDEYELLFQQDP
jgi:hypothetical protein